MALFSTCVVLAKKSDFPLFYWIFMHFALDLLLLIGYNIIKEKDNYFIAK